MTWTSHGWWVGRGIQPEVFPRRLDCGGPHRCPGCALEAQRADAETSGRQRMAPPSPRTQP